MVRNWISISVVAALFCSPYLWSSTRAGDKDVLTNSSGADVMMLAARIEKLEKRIEGLEKEASAVRQSQFTVPSPLESPLKGDPYIIDSSNPPIYLHLRRLIPDSQPSELRKGKST